MYEVLRTSLNQNIHLAVPSNARGILDTSCIFVHPETYLHNPPESTEDQQDFSTWGNLNLPTDPELQLLGRCDLLRATCGELVSL